ncbi:hypothetical protein K3495_g4076, partial [Podosphaera aphanis]
LPYHPIIFISSPQFRFQGNLVTSINISSDRYEGEKRYRIWVPTRKENKLVRFSNVRFDESSNSVQYQEIKDMQWLDQEAEILQHDTENSIHPSDMRQIVDTQNPDHQHDEIDSTEHCRDNESASSNEAVGHNLSCSEIYQQIQNQENIDKTETESEMTEDQEDPLFTRRYNTRGANAKPSRKQAENKSVRGPNASKYGAYPIAYAAQYIAGTDLKMDPQSYEEAMSRTGADKWRSAIHEEYKQLYDKQTWTLQK